MGIAWNTSPGHFPSKEYFKAMLKVLDVLGFEDGIFLKSFHDSNDSSRRSKNFH